MKYFTPDRQAVESRQLAIANELYVKKVKGAGLYGKAFFGHKRSRSENWMLEKAWNLSVSEAGKRIEFQDSFQNRIDPAGA